MADRELATINTSGGLTAMQLGDVTAAEKVLTQAEVDAKIASVTGSLDSVKFNPQNTLPAYSEATLWYDNTRKALAYYDDVTTDPIHIAQEMLIHVFNDSEVTIPQGSVVRYSGFISDGLPGIVLAQADTISNARALGMVSTDMPGGDSGSIVVEGVLSGIDLSGYPQGERLYLSDTVAGGLTTTPGDIVCHLGGVISNVDIPGSFYVKVDNYQTLPTALAGMTGGSAVVPITTTWVDLNGYTETSDIIMEANPTTGEILAPAGGMYSVTANVVVTFDDIGSTPEFMYLRVLGDQGFTSETIPYSIARNGEGASIYPKLTTTLTAGENYKLQISASTTLTGVTYNYVSFELEAKRLVP